MGSGSGHNSELVNQDVCFVCGKPEPEYMSTDNEPEQAPPVPVCSLECEGKYLASKGLCAEDEEGGAGEDAAVDDILGGGGDDEGDWEDEALPPAKRHSVDNAGTA